MIPSLECRFGIYAWYINVTILAFVFGQQFFHIMPLKPLVLGLELLKISLSAITSVMVGYALSITYKITHADPFSICTFIFGLSADIYSRIVSSSVSSVPVCQYFGIAILFFTRSISSSRACLQFSQILSPYESLNGMQSAQPLTPQTEHLIWQ